MDSTGFSTRFSEIVRGLGGQNAAARLIGISQGGVYRLVSGGEPSLSTLKIIADKTGRSLLWLATGEGEENLDADHRPTEVLVPMRDVYAAAGDGIENHSEPIVGYMKFPEVLAREWRRPLTKIEAIRVRGDSMLPTVADGQWILIDLSDNTLTDGRIFAFRTPDGVRLKRFQRTIDGGGMLLSDNRDFYAPERITAEDITRLKIIGRAFWTERML